MSQKSLSTLTMNIMTENGKKLTLQKLQRKAYKAVLCAYVEDNSRLRELKESLKIENKPVEKMEEEAYEAVLLALMLDNPTINANENAVLDDIRHDFHISPSFHQQCVYRARNHPLFVQSNENTTSNDVEVAGTRCIGGSITRPPREEEITLSEVQPVGIRRKENTNKLLIRFQRK